MLLSMVTPLFFAMKVPVCHFMQLMLKLYVAAFFFDLHCIAAIASN